MAVNQISLFLENKTGKLADITKLLAENNINLRAISVAETSDYGILRILVDDSEKAAATLKEGGNIVSISPVTVIAVPDKPAGLSELLNILASEDVGIEYMYSLFVKENGAAYMVIRASDYDKLTDVIEKYGLKKTSADELGLK